MLQFFRGNVPLCRDTGHNLIDSIRILAGHAKNQAFGDGVVLAQRFFDGCGRYFSSRHIDLIVQVAAETPTPA